MDLDEFIHKPIPKKRHDVKVIVGPVHKQLIKKSENIESKAIEKAPTLIVAEAYPNFDAEKFTDNIFKNLHKRVINKMKTNEKNEPVEHFEYKEVPILKSTGQKNKIFETKRRIEDSVSLDEVQVPTIKVPTVKGKRLIIDSDEEDEVPVKQNKRIIESLDLDTVEKAPVQDFQVVRAKPNRIIDSSDSEPKQIVKAKPKPKRIIDSSDSEPKQIVKAKPKPKRIIDSDSDEEHPMKSKSKYKSKPERSEKSRPNIRVSPYYMNNRENFISFINKLFEDFRSKSGTSDITCANIGNRENKELMIHQQIVRDYINLYTPYRGLLLYHGLGSGKTCSSIGIVEGMKYAKRVIIMTPASLTANYISQLKECGDPMYKLNQHWKWYIADSPKTESELKDRVGVTLKQIQKQRGAWLPLDRKPNYNELSSAEKTSLNKQIDFMIRNKYKFIHYNGLKLDKWREMTNNFKENLFDRSVVVIDEAHNFISRIVNKLNKKTFKPGVHYNDHHPTELSLKLYEDLLSARDSKIVLLTGTPMVNYPNEIGILFNILRGYIKTWKIPIQTSKSTTKESLQRILEIEKSMDYFEYTPSSKTIIITRNPFGFENVFSKKTYLGVMRPERMDRELSDREFIDNITELLEREDITVKKESIEIESFKCLPDTFDEFNSMFVNNGKLENKLLLQKRIIGLTSYFRSAQEELMPRYNAKEDFVEERIPMSDYQFGQYEIMRISERDSEKISKKNMANREIVEKHEMSSSYRVFSRLFCNFVMPIEIGRPFPSIPEAGVANIDEIEAFGGALDEKARKAKEKEEEKARKALAKETEKAEKAKAKEEEKARKALAKEAEKVEKARVKEAEKVEKARVKEAEKAEKAKTQKKAPPKAKKTLKIPKEMENPVNPIETLHKKLDVNINRADEDISVDENLEQAGDKTYEIRIQKAFDTLVEHRDKYLTKDALKTYSPKFLKMLENIEAEDTSLHLVYSQFRRLEGIGIFAEVLKTNGWAEFKLKRTGTGWDINISEEDLGKPTYALYTGTEKDDEKELIRKIYNGEWNDTGFPSNIASKLTAISQKNERGQIIKVFMITASGSEGINLKNTRFVHIMEPYWHPTRSEQVIGRARRICSHTDLPQELQTINVFLYLMILTKDQIESSRELKHNDLGKLSGLPVTSDEALYEINIIKTRLINHLTTAIKESSIDCAIHPSGGEELHCLNFTHSSPEEFITTPSIYKESSDKSAKLNLKVANWVAKEIRYDDKLYALREETGDLYDHELYNKRVYKIVGNIKGKKVTIF